jgi:hypothetical protein
MIVRGRCTEGNVFGFTRFSTFTCYCGTLFKGGVWLKRHDCPHHIAWGWVGPSSGFCGTGERRESKRGEKRNLLKRKA